MLNARDRLREAHSSDGMGSSQLRSDRNESHGSRVRMGNLVRFGGKNRDGKQDVSISAFSTPISIGSLDVGEDRSSFTGKGDVELGVLKVCILLGFISRV